MRRERTVAGLTRTVADLGNALAFSIWFAESPSSDSLWVWPTFERSSTPGAGRPSMSGSFRTDAQLAAAAGILARGAVARPSSQVVGALTASLDSGSSMTTK